VSRSEHGNARDKHDPRDVARKRLIVAERRVEPARPDVAAEALPIEVIDRGPTIHYPALEDLRGLMSRLPAGSLDGISGIDLRLTRRADPEDDVELLPGVYGPPTLGTYQPRGARIQLFAYVYDDAIIERPILEMYLRLQMLTTLVHEIGHHIDHATRTTRGRWRADRTEEREERAEAVEEDWVRAYVVPYVVDTYPTEVAELQRWMCAHGGIAMPLELLCNDDGPVLLEDAFLGLLGDVLRDEPALATKIDFAFNLHYAYHFDLALTVIDGVLASEPTHVDALRWRAHILSHLERHAEADAIARALLERDPGHSPSLWLLRKSALREDDWSALRAITTRQIDLDAERDTVRALRERFSHLYWRTWAALELGDFAAAERDLAAMRSLASTPENDDALQVLTGLCHLRCGRYREAIEVANGRILAGSNEELLEAIRVEATLRSGQKADVAAVCAALRDLGHGHWADRLAAGSWIKRTAS